jgi:phosphatidylglycerophosphate synthase
VRAHGMPLRIMPTADEAVFWTQLNAVHPETAVTVMSSGIVPSPQLLGAARGVVPDRSQTWTEVPAGSRWPKSGVFRGTPPQLAAPSAASSELTRASRGRWPASADVSGGDALLSIRVPSRRELAAAEQRLRASIFKPTDGPLGRFNRRLSLPISVWLIRWTRLNAHAMSVLLVIMGLYAGWLFSRGSYTSGLLAALVSLAASILDGCDGELARLQYKESAFGCWLDTLGDYTYYAAVFTGLTVGAVHQTGWSGFWWIGAVLLTGTFLTFALLILLRERITSGDPERLRTTTKAHFYSRGKRWTTLAARLSECATRASMPYGILVFAIFGLLPVVLVIAAIGAQIYWVSLATELRSLLNPSHRLVGRVLTH